MHRVVFHRTSSRRDHGHADVLRLEHEHAKLNPARITRRINQIQQQLIELASARTQGTRPAA